MARTHPLKAAAVGAALVTSTALLAAGFAMDTPAAPAVVHYTLDEHRDYKDGTFNQLLGVNDKGQIAGYYGSGTTGHPNVGYVTNPPYTNPVSFHVEDFPGAVQTQVVAINDSGTTGGFYVDPAGNNFGFVRWRGTFMAVIDPAKGDVGTTNQILGVNDQGVAVGFYTDAAGNDHGYRFDFHTDIFTPIAVPGATSVTATGINDEGTVVGFYTSPSGPGRAFLLQANGAMKTWAQPGASATEDFGINDTGRVVGSYTLGTGTAAQTFGFVRQDNTTQTVIDPSAATGPGAMTVFNGIANNGDLVGFYLDPAGNTDGVLAVP
jgi:probable HAF family extracellular repeat protein